MTEQPTSGTASAIHYEVIGYRKDGGDPLVISKPVDPSRFERVRKARNICLFAVALEEKIKLLLENFAEFEFELLRLAETRLIWPMSITLPPREHIQAMQERLTLDRRLVNLLTSCRLYLDQTDHGISQLYGNPSQQLDDVKRFKSSLYDACFGYRFMEALRNHVQHSGLPVHMISYRSSRIECRGRPDYDQITVCPRSVVSELAENNEFKASVLKELTKMGDKIDLRGPVRDYLSCLIKLHSKLREVTKELFESSRSFYSLESEHYSVLDGIAVDFPRLLAVQGDGTVLETIELTTRFLEYYGELVNQNAVSSTIPQSEASNTNQKA